MKEFEIVLSYTFRVTAETWPKAVELAHNATVPLPHTIPHPQRKIRRPVLRIEVGEGFEEKDGV